MSDRQIAKAATSGKRITFRFLSSQPFHEVSGYVVGMDDYHWLIASVLPEEERAETDEKISISMVHKSRVDLILIGRKALQAEPVADAITSVGQGFWDHCDRTFNGR
jgi:hypothetical protein